MRVRFVENIEGATDFGTIGDGTSKLARIAPISPRIATAVPHGESRRRPRDGGAGSCRYQPLLTPTVWPVLKPVLSEHRKAHVAATSSGVPLRRTGVIPASRSGSMLPSAAPLRAIGVSMIDPAHRIGHWTTRS